MTDDELTDLATWCQSNLASRHHPVASEMRMVDTGIVRWRKLFELVNAEMLRRQAVGTWRVAAIDALYEAKPERDRAALAILTAELADDEVGEAPDPRPPPCEILVGDRVRVTGPAVWAIASSLVGRTGTVIDPRNTWGIGPIPDDQRIVRLDGLMQPGESRVVPFHVRYLVNDEDQGGYDR